MNQAAANKAAQNIGAVGSSVTNLGLAALQGYNAGPLDMSGAPAFATTGDLSADRQKYADTSYAFMTQNLDRDKAREIEDQQQELANRGISYNPADPNSLWGKSMQSINERYDTQKNQAANQAWLSSGTEMTNMSNLSDAARAAYMNEQLTQRNLPLTDAQSLLNMSQDPTLIQAWLNKYATDKDFQAKQAATDVAAANNTGPIIGGSAPGFNV